MNEKTIIIDGVENIIRTPKEPNSKALIELYDVCNRLFKDKPNCFYTSKEVQELKENGSKIFI